MTAFDGTCAIVTGAASGLGAATAIGFARGGARVIINCVSSAPDAEATADLCSPAGATVRVWLLIDAAAPARAGRGTGRAARSSAPAQLLADRAPRQRGSHLTCMGLFLSSGCYWVLLTVLCSERERPFFIPSPAIRFPERAEGVKGADSRGSRPRIRDDVAHHSDLMSLGVPR